MVKKSCFVFLFVLFIVNIIVAQEINNDWENPASPVHNTMKPAAWFIPYPGETAALSKGNSPFVQSLDGIWKFNLVNTPAERPAAFYKDNYDLRKWHDIKVPASWQTEGFDRFIFTDVEYPIPVNPPYVPADYNPVGSYKKSFTVPAGWKDKDVFIHFGAVSSFFYLWINEQYIGFSKDSKTEAKFNITPYLKKGQNTVSVQVFRFSDGSYLEGQDMWKLSGIERSVYLTARPSFSVYDFFVKASLDNQYKDGIFNLKIAFNKKPSAREAQQAVQVKIIDEEANNKILFQATPAITANGEISINEVFPGIKKWNAETPHLYTLIINHLNKDGKIIESISHKIGFRKAEILHGLFLVNGVAVKFKGVNRHEFDMINGKVITREQMIRDIKLFKEYNINAVRNSHYPNAPEWYALCDQYGVYVVDEANIECDGMSFSPLKTLSDKAGWKNAYLNRTERMFEANKNFSSVITWSLGNESQMGDNFMATYQYLKSVDDSRPVAYEPASRTDYSDVFFPMYKSLNVMQEYVKEWRSKPYIQCEYAHMMGNSGGNLKEYWDLIYSNEQLQGGYIWDFSDQTFKIKDKNGRDIWGYGRDMGKVGETSDTSFCADGLFSADRKPHPQAFELKKIYQNIHFSPVDFAANKIDITNRFDFTNLSQYNFEWYIKGNGVTVAQGKLGRLDMAPHTTKTIQLNTPVLDVQPGVEYFLTINAKTKQESPLLPADFLVAFEQFKLPVYIEKQSEAISDLPSLELLQTNDEVKIFTSSFTVLFDKKSGWLSGYDLQGMAILKDALAPHFWRTATDNDIGNSQQIRCAVWQDPLKTAVLDSITVKQLDKQHIEVSTFHYLPDVKANYLAKYRVAANGSVQVNIEMLASAGDFPEMPRFGMRVVLHKAFDNVKWFGRGPFDNYEDRKSAATIDMYQMPADSLFHPYARAQESGYRTDVRWISLTNKQGLGLMAEGDPVISTGVLHFDMHKLEFNKDAPENNHGGSMTNDDLVWWNIDYRQMGVGGDNSWGAKPHARYLLPYRNYQYTFTLRPVKP